MTEVLESFVVEYSPKQNCFHIQTFEDMLKVNARTVANKQEPGYIVLGIYEEREDADKAFAELSLKIRGY